MVIYREVIVVQLVVITEDIVGQLMVTTGPGEEVAREGDLGS